MRILSVLILATLYIINLIINLSLIMIIAFIEVIIIEFTPIFNNKISTSFCFSQKKCYKIFYKANKLYPLFKNLIKEA